MIVIWMFSVFAVWQTDWELRKDKDGIQVFVKDTEDIPVKAFKGVAVLDASPETILKVIQDVESYPEWLDKCSAGEVIEIVSEQSYYIHTKMDMPFPVTDRDVVQKVTIDKNYQGGILITMESAADYIDEVEGFVRVPYSAGHWFLSPKGTGTFAEIVSENDPGGTLPKWLVNAMIVSTPFNMMKDMEKFAQGN